MLAFKVSRPNCICMLHVIPKLANISGLGNEIAKVAYVCFMCTSEAYQQRYEFQLNCGFHQPSSDS